MMVPPIIPFLEAPRSPRTRGFFFCETARRQRIVWERSAEISEDGHSGKRRNRL